MANLLSASATATALARRIDNADALRDAAARYHALTSANAAAYAFAATLDASSAAAALRVELDDVSKPADLSAALDAFAASATGEPTPALTLDTLAANLADALHVFADHFGEPLALDIADALRADRRSYRPVFRAAALFGLATVGDTFGLTDDETDAIAAARRIAVPNLRAALAAYFD